MAKYRLLRERLMTLPSDVTWTDPARIALEELLLAHDPGYVERVLGGAMSEAEIRRLGFPWSEALVERSLRSSGATLHACSAALREGLGVNLAGVEIILNMRRKIEQMQHEVNEFMEYVKREMARGIGDWEQRLSTALAFLPVKCATSFSARPGAAPSFEPR